MKIYIISFFLITYSFYSCTKMDTQSIEHLSTISQTDLHKIEKMGFSISGVKKYSDGFIIENDIFIHKDSLDTPPLSDYTLRVAQSEQYRTFNVVKIPRTISISGELLSNRLNIALDTMINRYNKLNLNLKFRRVISDGYIKLYPKYDFIGGVIASAGFPDSDGNPYRSILVNMNLLNNYTMQGWGVILQHEIGHCIGFRHTDYMDRSFSCSIPGSEPSNPIGAIHIPGTTTEPNLGSFMLACFDGNSKRSFNSNDIIAMRYLFK
jgi:hypothetical protein